MRYLIGFLLILGCGRADSPSADLQRWMKAMKTCDIQAIRKGITKESLDRIDGIAQAAKELLPEDRHADFDVFQQMCKAPIFSSTEILSQEITGNTAVVTVQQHDKQERLTMRKEEGLWKMDFAALMKADPSQRPPTIPTMPFALPENET